MPDIGTVLSTIVSGVLLGGMLALTALGLSIVLGVMRLVNPPMAISSSSAPMPASSFSNSPASIPCSACP